MAEESHDLPQRPGPLTRFWSWLSGDSRAEILALRAEWAEYEMIFNDLLTRWSAKLARDAKMEKKRLDRIQAQVSEATAPDHRPVPDAPHDRKAAARAAFARMHVRGNVPMNGGTQNVAADQDQ